MQRTEIILRDIGARLILTSAQFATRFAGFLDRVLTVDHVLMSSLQPSEAPPCSATPDTSAFIIYTSGSTGIPKGVVLTHGSLSTSLHYLAAKFGLSRTTRMVQFSAYTFDISIQDIYTTWQSGGCLCVISEDDRITNLGAALRSYGVNCAGLTSTVAGFLAPEEVPSLKTLVLLGEAVKPAVVARWLGRAAVFNAYGPSECSIQSSCRQLVPECNALNIGYALAGALWVVDANNYNRLVPIGAPGELLIEGPLLAREYLNDPIKTAAAFVSDPTWVSRHGLGTGRRMYRTGDLVYQNPDGSIIYIGRRDTQIKVRGQRVEVGEIEHHSLQHEAVADVAVVLPRQGCFKDRLVSLLTLQEFCIPTAVKSDVIPVSTDKLPHARRVASKVSEYLAGLVPEHMIPNVWIPLSSKMPQNESGKLDRKCLGLWVEAIDPSLFEALTATGGGQEEHQSLSATPLELRLRQVWSAALRVPESQIPVQSRSFLSSGGDSITAMQVVSSCAAQGISVAVRDVLQSQSIAQLALKAGVRRGDGNAPDAPFPLSPAQRWLAGTSCPPGAELRCDHEYRHNHSVYLAVRRPLERQDFLRAINALVVKHPMLRARFRRDSAQGLYQSTTPPGLKDSYRFDAHDIENRDKIYALIAEAQGTLHLERGPVFSALFMTIGAGGRSEQLLFMNAHKLVADHASWRIILSDLDNLLLSGATAGTQPPFPFQEWIDLQPDGKKIEPAKSDLAVSAAAPNLDYWGLTSEHNLHGDAVTEERHLDEADTSLLLGDANRALRTEPVEIMLAALLHSFFQTFPDRASPTLVEEGNGRDSTDGTSNVSETVGQFTRMVPIDVPAAGSGEDALGLLRRTKDLRREIQRRGRQLAVPSLSWLEEGTQPSSGTVDVLLRHIDADKHLKEGNNLLALEQLSAQGTSPVGDLVRRQAVFVVEVSVANDVLCISLQYNRHMRQLDKVHRWIQRFVRSLRELAAELSAAPSAFTLSDFPLVGLDKEGLEKLHKEVLPAAGLRPDDVEDIYPCSPMQQGILMSQAKSPAAYQIQQTFEIRSLDLSSATSVSPERVARAWQVVVDRHSMLRTVFVPSIAGGEHHLFDQVVLRSHKTDVDRVLCGEDNELERELASKTDLTLGGHGKPSHKLTLVSTPSGRVYAALAISHALVDAYSLSLLQTELVQAYDGTLTPASAGPRYGAFVAYLQQTSAEEALQFWSARLSGAQPCYLPALTESGFPALAAPEAHARRSPFQMVMAEVGDVQGVRDLAGALGVTVATVFQLAWGLVLSQYTGSADVCFGYLTSGRDVPVDRAAELFGPLINIMVSRLQVDPEMKLEQALRLVQGDFLDGFQHQRASLLEISHALRLEGQSLFNTCLSYRHAMPAAQEEGGSIALDVVAAEDPTEYDVTVNVLVSGGAISVALQYLPTFISADGATRLVEGFLQAVRSMAKHPDSSLSQVHVLTQEDESKLCEWNCRVAEADIPDCIPDLVRRQRGLRPDAVAVCAWDGEMTYRELEDAADRLAHHLATELAVGPEVMVALCFDKSRWAIVAQLAVLKAGGVVVSINPKHPAERLGGILTDLVAQVMLATADDAILARFGDVIPNVLGVDSGLLSRLPERTGPACRTLRPENAAFVIYTSGSTGVPKGVVLTHASLRSSFEAHGRVYGMGPGTRSLQFAAYTFDASISDIWGTLAHGGCVCVISEDERMNELQHAVSAYRANLAQLTPTVAGLLDPSTSTTLETLVLGGESVKLAMIEHLLKPGSVKVFNGYGPSECSIYTTCSQPLSVKSQPSNIGRVLVGGVWVVNTIQNTICPVGGVGELWIEGPLLARGYHHDQAKTDASFVVNPPWAAQLPQLQGRRFYRTGDVVRQNTAGEVLYIGRKDTQVKIRGQRVEIGEIEHRVKKALPPSLRTVAVTLVLPGGNANNPMLAITVQGTGSAHLQEDFKSSSDGSTDGLTAAALLPMPEDLLEIFAQLHASLMDALPSYMVPRLLFPFARLPFTSSGKLDRRLLRAILEGLPEEMLFRYSLSASAGKTSPPTTATETELQSLWATCLGVEPHQVGIRDHFLHAGGDSFTAMRLVSKANAAGLPLTVGDVFRRPVLADMAHFLDEVQRMGGRQESRQGSSGGETQEQQEDEEDLPRFALWEDVRTAESLEPSSSSLAEELRRVAGHCGVAVDAIEDVLPCTPVQEALMAATAQRPDAYVSRWVYRMPRGVDCHRFREAWSRLAQAAPILRTRVVPGRLCGAVQVIVRGELSWFSGGDLNRYLADEEERRVGYGTALFRHAVIESPEGKRHFVLTAHHSGYDGWSLTKLLDAVTRAYDGREIPSMPPLSRFLRFLAQQDPEAAQCFWRAQFEGDDDTPFPTSPRPSYRPDPAQVITLGLEAQPVRDSITLTTLLRAAWALAVSAHTRHKVVFAEVRTGRAAPVRGIFDMAGPVITTVPVRIHVDNKQRVAEFLAAVQQQATDMLAFEHTGLQRIRRLVGRDLGIGHLFTVQPAKGRDGLATSATFLDFETVSEPLGGADDYGLSVECRTGADGDESAIQVYARFDETMVSRSLLQRVLGRFKHVFSQLAGIIQSGGTSEHARALVGDIKMLSPDEVAQVAQWNSGIPERRDALVHELVSRPGSAQPEAPAICSWDGCFSHGELDRLAEQLAHRLADVGVGAEVMVPLCFDKTKWAIVSILAVLKAGGAVVPISAEPVQRAQTILRDVQANVVLTSPRYVSRFQGAAAHVLPVDDALFANLPVPPSPLEPSINSSNAAFIIYTSGSTGVPKGVVLEHGSMLTSMQAHGARFGMNPETRAFQFASFTFDISLHDMLTTLQFGGCVCMPSEEERVNDMAGAMRRMGVNYSFLPPRVLPTLQPSDIPGLQTLIVGGESLHAGDIEPWLSCQRRVFNAYGPAECCIISTCNELVDATLAPNIGHALAGGLWVVDETDPNRLVPIGVVGELLIEGPLLARGYLNDPEKTSGAFIVDPVWLAQYRLQATAVVPGAATGVRRMYRTGDLVRQNDDGSLTYVGRRDSQVKIRGQRVEIGEVEHHLKQQTAVLDAIVLYPSGGPAKSRLVAILTLGDFEEEPNLELQPLTLDGGPAVRSCVSQARNQLHGCLPPYMIPDVWIPLASIPQNNSNKADRKRLVQWLEHMDAEYLESITFAGELDVPATPISDIERQLQAVVGEVLHLSTDAVAMNRSFLSLGGDSISAMQIVSLSRSRRGLSVAVQDVLQSRSIADLSRRIAAKTPHSAQAVDSDYVPFSLLSTQRLLLESSALQEDLKSQAGIADLADVEDMYPCSPVQQGIIMSQVKGQATYRVQQICEIRPLNPTATVDLDKLARSWEAVVSRHAILRTVFIQAASGSSQFYQAVLKRWKPKVRIIHCEQASQVVSAFAREGESLDAQDGKLGPQHRLTLCTTEAGGTYAQLDMSHALTDASSLSIIFRDAILAYDGALTDVPAPSYGSYISFTQRRPAGESLAYWTNRLSDAQPCFLPRSTLPSPVTRTWKTIPYCLDDISLLRAFRDAHGVTMANLVQLAWAVVLAGYTGSADAIFGYLANGRDAPIPGAGEIVGPMINMMVSRIQLSRPQLRGKTVAQAAQQVQNDALEAFSNQRTSLSEIQHALHLSGKGLFNTTVSYYRPSTGKPIAGSPGSPSLTAEYIAGEDPTEYDANVSILAGEHTMDLSLQYSTSFLDGVSARHLLDSLLHALLSMAANPGALIEDLDVLAPSDVQLLRRWNSHVPPAIPGRVHDQIHQQSLRRPAAPAVCAWDGELTYSELDGLADRLARHLTALGVVEESMVGLCFEKSAWAVVAMLAVAKAGGVAVPLGVQLPPQRLRLLLDDSRAAIILTSHHCAPKFDGLGATTTAVITVGADLFSELPDVTESPSRPCLSAENAAVVIYTSGSTGRPKGVVLTHGALCTSLERHGAKLNFGTNTRTLQFSAYVWDISLLDVLGTLRFGGCVCVVSDEDRMDIGKLTVAMERMGVNLAVLTPTVASLIRPETVPTLRTVGLAGEAVSSGVVETWSPHATVFNCYGPAECTVLSTIQGPVTEKDQSNNIGTPLAGVVWVADQHDHNRLAPIGGLGELLIEGPLLARGYLNDPEKTSAAFVTDPGFIVRHGLEQRAQAGPRRMYRTGDLVRQNPVDGSLLYVGRKDGFVKLRGQRLEVGEIEYWTKRIFAQAQTVAVELVRPSVRHGEPILAVALELQSGSPHADDDDPSGSAGAASSFLPLTDSLHRSLADLQLALADELPPFMVPSLYVPVREIPLTASGKLDRKQLRASFTDLSEAQLVQYALAETASSQRALSETEVRLRELWSAALNSSAETIGPRSHFFRLGGDSVTAMRLVALACGAEPAITLSVVDVFKNPVLESLAKSVEAVMAARRAESDGAAATEADVAPFSLLPSGLGQDDAVKLLAAQCNVAPEAIEDAYPSTPLQEGLLAVTARQQSAYVSHWVFRLGEQVDSDRLEAAWRQVVELAPILRTRILAGGESGTGVQVVVREQIDWVAVSSDLAGYLAKQAVEPMGFGTRLARFATVTTPSERFFVWTIHHSIYDGWTARKLLEAVGSVYREHPAPSFAPYTRFVRYLQQTNSTANAEKYWQSQLQGDLRAGFPTRAPGYWPRPSSIIKRRIRDAAVTKDSAVTTATLLRAAWALVVSQETGSRDVLFAAPLSGRTAPVPGILDITAPTLATVPVRIGVDLGRTAAEYLAAIQEQAVGMMPFEHTGLQHITQMLPDKTLPLNHLFVVQPFADRLDHADTSSLLPGLELVPAQEAADFHNYPLIVECNTGLGDENGSGSGGSGSSSVELEMRFDEATLPIGTVQSMLDRFEIAFAQLQTAAATRGPDTDSDRLLSHLQSKMVSSGDISRISEWNTWGRETLPTKNETCVHELVRRQRIAQPDAQAVHAWDGDLSYAQLGAFSLRLAQHLASLGVGPETPVCAMFEKSRWAIVAQLATLEAGGAVVPVNYKHPNQRIKDIVNVAGAKVILTSGQHADRCRELVPHVVVVNEHLLTTTLADHDGAACEAVRPTNAAFIIFTSGSTGVPKGVVLEHHALATSLQAEAALFSTPAARTLQFSAFTFDISIAEIFMTLAVGGCVCVISEDDRVNNLASAMQAACVNIAYLTPTVLSLLEPQQVPALATLILIGEALEPSLITPWLGRNVRLFNAYGPAECCILSTCSRQISDAGQAPNIGSAIANSNLWIVDQSDFHRLVPIGVAGELLIEGPLLARGYLGDEEKTAAAFVTDPSWLGHFAVGPRAGRRYYRTGDLVRQSRDGSLVYLGRKDAQAKIYGQRMEMGEIEHWVTKQLVAQGQKAVAVASLINAPTQPVLAVALELEPSSDEPAETVPLATTPQQPQPDPARPQLSLLPLSDARRRLFDELRDSLSGVLPAYMVPALYFPVTKLPLTDSGKLDRKQIWKTIQQTELWPSYSLAASGSKDAPSTDTERQLQQLWARVLRTSARDIGARDDFFRSGGDSIAAMRLVAAAREAGQTSLTVADVFQHPVLSDLARTVDAKQGGAPAALAPIKEYQPFSSLRTNEPLERVKSSLASLISEADAIVVDAAPVTDFQALAVISTLRKSRDLLAYVSLDGEGSCNVARWTESCHELIRNHEILRTAYVYHNGELVQAVLREYKPEIAYFETDSVTIEEFTAELISRDMDRPTRLGRPFVEFAILAGPSRHRILLRISHAEYDNISLSYFVEHLRAIHSGEDLAVPGKHDHPGFTRYMSTLATGVGAEDARRYWRTLLEGAAMPRIRLGPPRLSRLIPHGARSVRLPNQQALASPAETGSKPVTAATLVRAAWALVLARHTGRPDVVFGDIVSGRNTGDPVAARAAGCCVNIVPVRAFLDPAAPAGELLRALQQQQIARLPHETLGFREYLAMCPDQSSSSSSASTSSPAFFFTSRVNHLDRAPEFALRIGETAYRATIALPDGAQDPSDVTVTSLAHPGDDRIDVALGYAEGAVGARQAEAMLAGLCAAIELLAHAEAQHMALGALLEQMAAVAGSSKPKEEEEEGGEHVNGNGIAKGLVETHAKGKWDAEVGGGEKPDPAGRAPYYRGDVVGAGCLAFGLQQKLVEIDVDDVLEGRLPPEALEIVSDAAEVGRAVGLVGASG